MRGGARPRASWTRWWRRCGIADPTPAACSCAVTPGWPRAPEHHRPGGRRPADVQRGRHGLDHLQRRDLQLRRAARRPRGAAATVSARAPTPRSSSTLYEEHGQDCVRAVQRPVRLRDLGRARTDASSWRATASACGRSIYARTRRPVPLRLRGQGAARRPRGRRASSTRARSTRCSRSGAPLAPRTIFRACRELPPGHLAADRQGGRSRSSRYWRLPRTETPVAGRSEQRLRRGAARACWSTRAHPAARRRAGRRLPERRPRLLGHHRACPPLHRRGLCDLLGHVRGPGVRRERVPARSGRRTWAREHHDDRAAAPRTSARVFPDVVWHAETAVAAHRPGAAVPACRSWCASNGFKVVLTGEGADEMLGGYDIFKEASPALLGAQPDSARRAAAAASASIRICRAAGQSPAYLQAFFQARPDDLGEPVLLAPAALGPDAAARSVFFSDDVVQASCATTDPIDELRRRPARRLRALASVLPGAVPRDGRSCCPATSCPRRATAWRWRTRSRGASRSSITAWSEFAGRLPPA